jgi:hypothetical protein
MNASNFVPTRIPKTNGIPEVSASFPMIYLHTKEPSTPNAPSTIFGVPLTSVELPYKVTKKNANQPKPTGTMSIIAGQGSTPMTMFNPTKGLVAGNVYSVEGATFTEFLALDDNGVPKYANPLRNASIAFLRPHEKSATELISAMPFENRCILPSFYPSGEGYNEKSYHFFAADIDYKYPLNKQSLAGAFTLPETYDANWFQHITQKKEEMTALTGGLDSPNQVLLNQTNESGVSKSFLVYTRLFDSSIHYFQTENWKVLGFHLMQHQKGLALFIVNAEQTKTALTENPNITAVLVANTTFIPDLQSMIPKCGVELGWESVVKMCPRLGDGTNVVSESNNVVDIRSLKAANILRLTGDISAMIKFSEWVKFYVVFNHRASEDEIMDVRAMSDTERFAWIQNPRNWDGRKLVFDIYAVCTEDSPQTIDKFLCAPGQKALIHLESVTVESKRMRVQEEEEEEED